MYDTEYYTKWLKQLVEDESITNYEKTFLMDSLNDIEKNIYIDTVMYRLKNNLSPLALRSELSPKLFNLYQHLNRYFSLPGTFSWLNFFNMINYQKNKQKRSKKKWFILGVLTPLFYILFKMLFNYFLK